MFKLWVVMFLALNFVMGILSFLNNYKHLLMTLLSLEFLGLLGYLGLFFCLTGLPVNLYFCLVYLTFVVSEGVLGLSIMVAVSRYHGGDYLQFSSLGRW
uniref:NADH-ubiquinone oxidoreductase chain 4L n=1 Tax=Teloganodidae sp. MT-2014 TaxID=1560024 RepID=A0A0A0RWW8_9INSE|nr:NADH dehydrogenase subunit 4L [Teloganodidae sp. MT-2014]